MSRPGEKGDRSIALFLLALLLFSPLFLSIFSSEELFLGVPPLFLYLFAAWGGIIAAVGWSASRDNDAPTELGRNSSVGVEGGEDTGGPVNSLDDQVLNVSRSEVVRSKATEKGSNNVG